MAARASIGISSRAKKPVMSQISGLRRHRCMPENSLRIAVAGGTGTLGRRVTEELRSRGHDVRVLSRRSPDYPVDLTTGDGLAAAVAGCDVVVDVSNDASKHAARTLVDGSRRLLAAGQAAGVGHHVAVSIVGCDRVPMGYFRAKLEQERVVERGPVPWSLVRATQFHELVAATLAPAARWRVLPVPRAARAADPGAAAGAARPGAAGRGADRRAARRQRHDELRRLARGGTAGDSTARDGAAGSAASGGPALTAEPSLTQAFQAERPRLLRVA
jgi:uncharacterized protein YbjT (DUF2867 family)